MPGPEGATDGAPDFADLVADARQFSQERGWTPVQTPKNLAMALAGEAGELLAELQWLDSEESVRLVAENDALRERVAMELADVAVYLARFADVTGIDVMAAATEKMRRNRKRFPVGTHLRLRSDRPASSA